MTEMFDEIWPSHADFPVYPDCIRKLAEGARQILDKEIQGKAEDFFGNRIMVYDLGFTAFLCNG